MWQSITKLTWTRGTDAAGERSGDSRELCLLFKTSCFSLSCSLTRGRDGLWILVDSRVVCDYPIIKLTLPLASAPTGPNLLTFYE